MRYFNSYLHVAAVGALIHRGVFIDPGGVVISHEVGGSVQSGLNFAHVVVSVVGGDCLAG